MRNFRKIMRSNKSRLLTLALTGLLASCTSKNKPLEPTPPPAPVIYTLTLDANGGSLATGTNATQQIVSGEKASRPADPTLAQEGQWDFAFAYWSADKQTRFDFNAPAAKTAILYAMWSVRLPDANFRDSLKGYAPNAFDGDRLVVNYVDITGLTSMDIGNSYIISDLSGIEFFTALTELYCSNNRLAMLDVSRNTVLTSLECSQNRLTELDVRGMRSGSIESRRN